MESSGPCRDGSSLAGQYALVSYLPPRLTEFLDRLRLDLVPTCKPRAHVTVLPPRSLCGSADQAVEEIRQLLDGYSPFPVQLGEVSIFPGTNVVYLEIVGGIRELRQLHRELSRGVCSFNEPFQYHPHITLAQNFAPDLVQPLAERAREAWRNFPHERSFLVETLSFVQSDSNGCWNDLADFELPVPASR